MDWLYTVWYSIQQTRQSVINNNLSLPLLQVPTCTRSLSGKYINRYINTAVCQICTSRVNAILSIKTAKTFKKNIYIYIYFFFCGAATLRESWRPHSWGFLDHTQRRTTVGRTPMDEWSAHPRDLYLTTHNIHNRQTSMPPVGFEPTISAGERPQTYALDRAATGTGS